MRGNSILVQVQRILVVVLAAISLQPVSRLIAETPQFDGQQQSPPEEADTTGREKVISLPPVEVHAGRISAIALPSMHRDYHATTDFTAGIVREVPGVFQFDLGGRVSKVILNGLSFYEISTIFSNTEVRSHRWGSEHSEFVTWRGPVHVDIYPGTAGQFLGGAPGGTMVVTPVVPHSADSPLLHIGIESQNVTDGGIVDLYGSWHKDRTDIAAFASGTIMDYRSDPEGDPVPGTEFREAAAGGMLVYRTDYFHSRSTLLFRSMEGALFEEHGQEEGDEEEQEPYQSEFVFLGEESLRFLFEKTALFLHGSFALYGRKEVEEGNLRAVDITNAVYELGGKYLWSKVSIPFHFSLVDFSSDGEELFLPGAKEVNLFTGVGYEWRIPSFPLNVAVNLGGKHRQILWDGNDTLENKAYTAPLGNLTLTLVPDVHHSIQLSGGFGPRFPAAYELSVRGPHPADHLFVIGNANVKTAFYKDFHLLYTLADGEGITLTLHGYVFDITDAISMQLTADTADKGFTIASITNVRKRVYGVDAQVQWQPLTGLLISPQLSWIQGKERKNAEWLGAYFIPQSHFDLNVTYDRPLAKKLFLTLGARAQYYFEKTDIAENEKLFWSGGKVPDYLLVHALASIAYQNVTATISVENLFNRRYRSHPSIFERIGANQIGRLVKIQLGYRI